MTGTQRLPHTRTIRTALPLGIAAAAALALAGCAGLTTASESAASSAAPVTHWEYTGDEGPDHWAELDAGFAACEGTSQSPIDLPLAATAEGDPIELTTHESEGTVADTGHTVQLTDEGEASSIEWHDEEYDLVQLHEHTPSEHTIDGVAADAELHLVHQAEDESKVVLSVLVEEGAHNEAWQPFVEAAESGEGTVPEDLHALLPDSLEHLAYEGSLTTPPCTENVHWVVLTTPIEFDADQLAVLESLHAGSARPTQALGDREVVHGAGTWSDDD